MSASVKKPSLMTRARQMMRREDGVAAVEFALIAPVGIACFIGTIEITQAVLVDRRVNTVAGAVGDLVARKTTCVTESEVNDIMKIASWLMLPYTSTGLQINLKSIATPATNATDQRVKWQCSQASGGSFTCSQPNSTTTVPTGLIGVNDGVVEASVEYAYRPLIIDYFMSGNRQNEINAKSMGTGQPGYARGKSYTFKEKVYFKPRGVFASLSTNGTCAM